MKVPKTFLQKDSGDRVDGNGARPRLFKRLLARVDVKPNNGLDKYTARYCT